MSRKNIHSLSVVFIVLVLLTINAFSVSASYTQPIASSGRGTGGTWANRINRQDFISALEVQPVDSAAVELMQFASSLEVNTGSQVAGIFVDDVMAYPVVQQPSGLAAYVSTNEDVLTQFSMPLQYGTVGILAHNFLAGVSFFDLEPEQDVFIVYGDGSTVHYVIKDVRRFQALQPNSPYSDFVDLDSNANYSSTELFYEVYASNGNLVLQTCIAVNGIDSWGRLFVIAEKVY